jgi:hypothetical protein
MRTVGVDRVTEQEFVAYGDDFDSHRAFTWSEAAAPHLAAPHERSIPGRRDEVEGGTGGLDRSTSPGARAGRVPRHP